jgi:hypothetical protein
LNTIDTGSNTVKTTSNTPSNRIEMRETRFTRFM